MTDNKPDRIKAEKEFHNARFADGQKHSSRYYLALQYWYSDYFLKVLNVSASRVLELGCGAESLSMQIDDDAFELDSNDIYEEADENGWIVPE